MRAARRNWQLLIPVFCIWHMFAVTIYLLPANAAPLKVRQYAARYVLTLSQWQKWDIFSPDPLTRVSDYRLERQTANGWETVRYMDFRSLPITTRAKELKVLGRLEDDWRGLTEPYLRAQCELYPSATLRLSATNIFLPRDLEALKRLSTTKLQTTEKILGTFSCTNA